MQTRSVEHEKDSLDKDHSRLIRERAQIELEVLSLEEKVENDTASKTELEKSLKTLSSVFFFFGIHFFQYSNFESRRQAFRWPIRPTFYSVGVETSV